MSKAKTSPTRSAGKKAGKVPTTPFPIVGIGASAGGLEAFTQLLTHLRVDTGMGFVLVQHLDRNHESALTQLLGRATSMPVKEITHNLAVMPNHVYVVPPNANLTIKQGVLQLSPRPPGARLHPSIDSFFTSLSEDQNERAIGVILSGNASDGTLGLEAIKAGGGISFAQDESAKHDSMPRSAIAAGCVDFVLSPEKIAKELVRIARHPHVTHRRLPIASSAVAAPRQAREPEQEKSRRAGRQSGFKKLFLLLRDRCGVDFSPYKPGTVQRRIHRRMVLSQQKTIDHYAAFLKENPKEMDALYSDLLISVTTFFRDPEAFEALKKKIFPAILAQGRSDQPFRAWVLGCSTGQEAYSVAMAYLEASTQTPRAPKLQIFATDLNESVVNKGRQGFYPKRLVADVSPERLERFFTEEAGGYRVNDTLRSSVVFARQNLLTDPPFSNMDFVSCRNLLIYLEPDFQKKFLPAFHYALKPEGVLFLGASESIGSFTSLFKTMDKKHKIYSRKPGPTPDYRPPSAGRGAPAKTPGPRLGLDAPPERLRRELNAQREADRIALNIFAPPSVLINAELDILQFRGATRDYLEQPTGKASLNVLKMAREGLMLPLRDAINQAGKENKTVCKTNVHVSQDVGIRDVKIQVVPLRNLKERCFLIFFEEAKEQERKAFERGRAEYEASKPEMPPEAPGTADRRNANLERELAESRDYTQSQQEHHEADSAELHATNKEAQSANEELQNLNEELETSKEELESTNEELTTMNEEMITRNSELNLLNNDLNNLHVSVNMAILVLDRDLTIRRFTPVAEKIFNLVAGDVGWPLSRIKHNLDFTGLEKLVREVIDKADVREREVQDKSGRWFVLRVRPYLTLDNKVDGAVLLLMDMDELKRSEQHAIEARKHAEASERKAAEQARLLDLSNDAIITCDVENQITYWNRGAEELYGWSRKEALGQDLHALLKTEFEFPLDQLLARLHLEHHLSGGIVQIAHDGRRIDALCRWALDHDAQGKPAGILTTTTDITVRKRHEEALLLSEERYRALFELVPIGVYSCDASGSIQNFNRRAAELWGREPKLGDKNERFCGSFKMHRPDGTFLPHEECPMAEVLAGKMSSARNAEVFVERPAGSRIAVIVNIAPLKNSRGEVTGAINCFYDVTERKLAEEILRASERLHRLLAGIGDLAARMTTSSELTKAIAGLIASELQVSRCGYSVVDLAGGQILSADDHHGNLPSLAGSHAISEYPEHFKDDALAGRVTVVEDLAADARTVPIYARTFEPVKVRAYVNVPLVRAGLWVANFWVGHHLPHSWQPSEIELMRLIAEQVWSVVEQTRTAVELRESEERFRSMADNIAPLAWMADATGWIFWYNRRWLAYTGTTLEELQAGGWNKVYHPNDVNRVVERMQHSWDTGEMWEDTFLLLGKDGNYRWFLSRAFPIRSSDGKISRWFGTNTDITELRETQEALQAAQTGLREHAASLENIVAERTASLQETVGELEAFSYTIAHDMRAPLRSMRGFSQTLLEEHAGSLDARGLDYLQRIDRSSNRLDLLIQDVLNYTKILREQVVNEPVDLARLLRDILDTYPSWQPPKAEIKIAGILPKVMGSDAFLTQCIANLLSNAVKFVPPGAIPSILIWAELKGDFVRLFIQDKGIGIAPDKHARIFRMFERINPARQYEGTGIGLTIVRKAVERMGGEIGFESELGEGSTFWIQLKKE